MNTIKIRKADVPAACLRAFPEYRGRKYAVEIESTGTMRLWNAYWSGGTKSDYVAVNLRTGEIDAADAVISNPFAVPHALEITIPEGMVIVEHVRFCGKDCGLRIHCRPDNVPQNLLPPTE